MGAKTTEQLNLRRPTVKCPICGRKFLNIQALRSHQTFLHSGSKTDVPNVKRLQHVKKQIDARQLKKRLVPVSMLKRVVTKTDVKEEIDELAGNDGESTKQANLPGKQASTSKIAAKVPTKLVKLPKDSTKSSKQSIDSKESDSTVQETKDVEISPQQVKNSYKARPVQRPEYECPVCTETFAVYFTAFKHIQHNHCVNEKGEKVPPNSPDLVKPIRTEICATCNKKIRSKEPHACIRPQTYKDRYACLGCNQVFNGLVLFQHHIKGVHGEGAQNYFFPTREEFSAWKKDLEYQTGLDYVKLNSEKTREMYHCSYQSPMPQATMHLCPCSLIIRDYATGVHVCHYKHHYGHTLTKEPEERYIQYCINLYTKNKEEVQAETDDENDLYKQFKTIMSNILMEATKVHIATLNELLGKALEMSVLMKIKEENEPMKSKSLTDAQISKSLENLKPNTKRKLSPIPKETKKVEIKRTRRETRQSIEKPIENGHSAKARSSPVSNKSISLSKSLKKNDSATEKKKEFVPEQEDSNSGSNLSGPRNLIQSPTSFSESYMHFVDQNFKTMSDTSTPKPKNAINKLTLDSSTPKTKNTVKKKEVMKTKIGQFKSKTNILSSPKDSSPKSSSPKQSKEVETPKVWKAKPDIKYEVKEQENDCNILILKI